MFISRNTNNGKIINIVIKNESGKSEMDNNNNHNIVNKQLPPINNEKI